MHRTSVKQFEHFGAVSRLLDIYSDPDNFDSGRPINALLPGVTVRMSDLCKSLERGIIPDLITCCGKRGNLVAPTKEIDLVRAVTYVLAAKAGTIPDRSPIKTVMEAFGCSNKKSVQEWVKRYTAQASENLSRNVELIVIEMRTAGRRYSKSDPGRSAIARRGHSQGRV
jgi:hypothetical protein